MLMIATMVILILGMLIPVSFLLRIKPNPSEKVNIKGSTGMRKHEEVSV
jgi:hypothetical protein